MSGVAETCPPSLQSLPPPPRRTYYKKFSVECLKFGTADSPPSRSPLSPALPSLSALSFLLPLLVPPNKPFVKARPPAIFSLQRMKPSGTNTPARVGLDSASDNRRQRACLTRGLGQRSV